MLLTFALGLASVFMIDGSLNNSGEIQVDLPTVHSDSIIVITPKIKKCIPTGGGSHFSYSDIKVI